MYREYTMMAHEETTRFLAYATFVNIYYAAKACNSVSFCASIFFAYLWANDFSKSCDILIIKSPIRSNSFTMSI